MLADRLTSIGIDKVTGIQRGVPIRPIVRHPPRDCRPYWQAGPAQPRRPMHARTGTIRWQWLLLAGLSAPGGGCVAKCMTTNPPIPDASVPRELSKIVLPPYVIEPPDVLLVQVMLPPIDKAVQEYKAQTAPPRATLPVPDTRVAD